ncbi:MAG: helix-turn-helix domain-containing protein [Nanoarchaeota archaeon]|nr:helix-turn-helix domain-containing protein [Nanoarchaeota archaeon]
MKELFDIINGTLLGDASIRSSNWKYPCYKLTAKDKNFLKWFQRLLNEYKIKSWISQDNKISGVHSLGFYINTCPFSEFKDLERRWYSKNENGSKTKIFPKDLELNQTILLHWYLGDGSFPRRKNDNNRVSPVVLSTNNFSKEDIDFMIKKLKELNLNFYPIRYKSGFTGNYCGYAIWSKVQDGTPFRFFKLIGIECPKEISKCITGRKGLGSNLHYFGGKWPTEDDWTRIMCKVKIGSILRNKRLELGWSQNQLSRKVGIRRENIRDVELCKRNFGVINFRKILKALDLNFKDFRNL